MLIGRMLPDGRKKRSKAFISLLQSFKLSSEIEFVEPFDVSTTWILARGPGPWTENLPLAPRSQGLNEPG